MLSHVRIVGILMIVHGCINAAIGTVLIFAVPVIATFVPPNNNGDQQAATRLFIMYGTIGSVHLACGVLNILSGVRVRQFRGRTLAIVALLANASSCIGGCWLTGIIVTSYGLIILFNGQIAHAFKLVDAGVTVSEVQNSLNSAIDYHDPGIFPSSPNASGSDESFRSDS